VPSGWPYYYQYPFPYPVAMGTTTLATNLQANLSGALSNTTPTVPATTLIPALPAVSALWSYNPAAAVAAAMYPLAGTYAPPVLTDTNNKKRLNSDLNGDSDTREAKRIRATNRPPQHGDWTCPKCGNLNWPTRTKCNMKKCGTPKPSSSTNTTDRTTFTGESTRSTVESSGTHQTLVEPGS